MSTVEKQEFGVLGVSRSVRPSGETVQSSESAKDCGSGSHLGSGKFLVPSSGQSSKKNSNRSNLEASTTSNRLCATKSVPERVAIPMGLPSLADGNMMNVDIN